MITTLSLMEKNFFNQPIKNDIRTYKIIRKISAG